MNKDKVVVIIELLSLIARLEPVIAPLIAKLLNLIKGEDVVDITHEELVARVDAAIAKLPPWV